MAYFNTGFPYQNPYQQPMLNAQPQIQNSGMISAPNEAFAFNYPVAPGNSVTFKDESLPFVYVKTMGLSQFDSPAFEKYRLVKEDATVNQQPPASPEYALKSDLESLKTEIETFMKSMKEGKTE